MQVIETAWKRFFKQFVPYVFTEGELIEDEKNTLYPRITFSYQMGDYFTSTVTTFQVWDWGHNSDRLLGVCDKIALTVPVMAGMTVVIPLEAYNEYLNPFTGQWVRFDLEDFQAVVDEFTPATIEWRTVETKTSGGIEVYRGTPFLVPTQKDEKMSRAIYGTLQTRYLSTI